MTNAPPPKRIQFSTIWASFMEVLNLEKGFLRTLKELALQPGEMIRNYFFTNKRFDYAKPFPFLLLLTAIGTILTVKILAFSQGEADAQIQQFPEGMRDYVKGAMELIGEYYNLYQVSQIPVYALATYWIFRSVRYYYAEHLILNCYMVAFSTFLFILIFPSFFISESLMATFAILILAYQIYYYHRIFQEKLLLSIGKTILVYFVASSLHGLLTILLLMSYFYLAANI